MMWSASRRVELDRSIPGLRGAMPRRVAQRSPGIASRHGFTLIEVVLAMLMASILAVALYTAMSTATRAARSATASVEPMRQVNIAADLMRQDLDSVLPPTGILAGPFMGTHLPGPTGDNDSLEFYSIGADPNPDPLNATHLSEGIRRIEIGIRTDVSPPVLVRRITRNLMPSSEALVEEEILCRDVQSFSVRYFDGQNWQENWDSTSVGDILPLSVALTIELTDPQNPGASLRRTSRIVPLSCGRELPSSVTGGGA